MKRFAQTQAPILAPGAGPRVAVGTDLCPVSIQWEAA